MLSNQSLLNFKVLEKGLNRILYSSTKRLGQKILVRVAIYMIRHIHLAKDTFSEVNQTNPSW